MSDTGCTGSKIKGWLCEQMRPDPETGDVADAPCDYCAATRFVRMHGNRGDGMSDTGPVEQLVREHTGNTAQIEKARTHDAEDAALREELRASRERIGGYVNDIVALRAALRQAAEALRTARELIGQMIPVPADHAPIEGDAGWVQCSEHEEGHPIDDCPQDLNDDDEILGSQFVEIRETAAAADAALAAIAALEPTYGAAGTPEVRG